MIATRSHIFALVLVGACDLYDPQRIADDAGVDARPIQVDAAACPRIPAWREVECSRLCVAELALCIGDADRNRCLFQCATLAPDGDYCPLTSPQF